MLKSKHQKKYDVGIIIGDISTDQIKINSKIINCSNMTGTT